MIAPLRIIVIPLLKTFAARCSEIGAEILLPRDPSRDRSANRCANRCPATWLTGRGTRASTFDAYKSHALLVSYVSTGEERIVARDRDRIYEMPHVELCFRLRTMRLMRFKREFPTTVSTFEEAWSRYPESRRRGNSRSVFQRLAQIRNAPKALTSSSTRSTNEIDSNRYIEGGPDV